MAYVVITGNQRKQFDSLKEAVNYSTVQSRIFQMDTFGNLTPMTNEMINELMEYEEVTRESRPQEPIQQDHKLQEQAQKKKLVDYENIEDKKNVKEKKKNFNFQIILYIIYFILIAIIIFAVYMILAPYWREFVGLNKDFGLT
ncbi:hypothetical protein GF327_02185 [Candidatus Woesearchaeota archaeon]|nr:hypothetical protein [Candidatus Woesearchaeota archaeon]